MADATAREDAPYLGTPLWTTRSPGPSFEALAHDLEVDVAVVGGGIVGATTALLLSQSDLRVALVEARRIGHGTTGHSTAKFTYHGAITFGQLLEGLDDADARLVVDGDRAALDVIRHWSAELGLEEHVREVTHWTWCADADSVPRLEAEIDAAATLGVETVWAEDGAIPFAHAAIGVAGQLLAEPVVLCQHFAGRAAQQGALVHEHTRVRDVHATDDCIVLDVDGGHRIRAKDVVVATQVPIVDRALMFAACSFTQSHVVALDAPDAFDLAPDMYTGIGPGGLSVRPSRTSDGRPVLVVAGNGHDVGDVEDGTHVQQLAAQARASIGGGELLAWWLAHDAFPHDKRSFLGPIRADERIYVASGFGGWGLARGVASAMAITGHIRRGHARWHHPLDATRLSALANLEALKTGAKTVTRLVGDRLGAKPAEAARGLQPGEGVVVRDGMGETAVARDTDGMLHAVDARCTHQGCVVRHDAQRSCWHCPCHGSRFALDGSVLNGPAVDPLERRDLPE